MIKEVKTGQKGVIKIFLQGEGQWMSVQQPKLDYSKTGLQYSIDIEANEKDQDTLLGLGFDKAFKKNKKGTLVKTESGKTVFNFIRPEKRKDGELSQKPFVLDKDGNEFDGLVGNGSEILAQISLFPYNNSFGQGMSARLDGIQVLNLIAYESPTQTLADNEVFSGKKLTNTGSIQQKTTTKQTHKKNEDLI